ncbi:prephenate dehydratase [Vibrio sp. EJY3]|nr:prephenate dehydratase [Vibrio sp. EJY3]
MVEKGVQDNKNNRTSFLLMKVEPREQTISENEARKQLTAAIEMGKKLAKINH